MRGFEDEDKDEDEDEWEEEEERRRRCLSTSNLLTGMENQHLPKLMMFAIWVI